MGLPLNRSLYYFILLKKRHPLFKYFNYNNANIFNEVYIRKCCSSPNETVTVLGNDKKLRFSTGAFARLADGCALVTLGDTTVMATAVSKGKSTPSPFLPLVVDYRQKTAAFGRIPTNFLRRESGTTEAETLISRVIDRSIRPLFETGYSVDTQVICSAIAIDGNNSPDILAINAASAALAVSDIPWNGPIGAVRVGCLEGELIVNPTKRELARSSLNLTVAATKQNLVVMLEGSANNMMVQDFQRAIKFGVKESQAIVASITEMQSKFGKTKRGFVALEIPEIVIKECRVLSEMRIKKIYTDECLGKIARDTAITAVKQDVIEKLSEYEGTIVNEAFNRVTKDVFRDLIFERNMRCDGRPLNGLRKISCSIDLFKPLHGSAMFQRGQTQVLTTVTLDSPSSTLKMDPASVLTSGLKEKNFFLHYEFPPYATNELGRVSGFGRRELGHGALAEKAVKAIIPNDFPFTLRLTSEVLESNGSSSMATVCGASLALMDAGVPVSAAVAGVAIGLITKYENNDTKHLTDYRLLTDILGLEDYMGDMDFKMAGTKKGVTAVQADIKIPGLPLKVIMDAVLSATEAKSAIIEIMNEVIRSPRKSDRENWPVIEKLQVPAHKRSRLIGLGGVNLRKLEAQIGVQVTTEENGDLVIFAPNKSVLQEAKEAVNEFLNAETEPTLDFGGIYTAKIVELREIGVMVTLYSSMPPVLIHNSQLDQRKVNHPSALGLEVGQEISVKYFGRDPVSGFMRLSRKVLQAALTPINKNLDRS